MVSPAQFILRLAFAFFSVYELNILLSLAARIPTLRHYFGQAQHHYPHAVVWSNSSLAAQEPVSNCFYMEKKGQKVFCKITQDHLGKFHINSEEFACSKDAMMYLELRSHMYFDPLTGKADLCKLVTLGLDVAPKAIELKNLGKENHIKIGNNSISIKTADQERHTYTHNKVVPIVFKIYCQ
jgi:hypothetical protein